MKNTLKNNRLLILIASATIGVALQGCAGVSPSSLQPADDSKNLMLKSDFSYEAYHSVSGIRWRWALATGRYVAKKKDKAGVYYLGPRQCLSQTLLEAGWGERESRIGKTLASVDCGVYVPDDLSAEPKVFVVAGSWQNYPKGKTENLSVEEMTIPITANATPNATPLQAGVGTAVGGAIVGAIVDAERGNYDLHRSQPSGILLRRALSSE